MREAGRPREAEELFKRMLKIDEARLEPKDRLISPRFGTDDPGVAVALHELGWCIRDAGRPR